MKYLAAERTVRLDEAELAALVEGSPGPLAPTALVDAATAAIDPAAPYEAVEEARPLLKEVLNALLDPRRRIDVHIAASDESIRRVVFASAGTEFAGLAFVDGGLELGMWTAGEIEFLIESALAAGAPIAPFDFAGTSSPEAVLALIAMLDALRMARMQSVITHTQPPSSVSLNEIAQRVADSGAEDFRWPLSFVDKLLPTPVAKVLTNKKLAAALAELADGGVVTLAEADGKAPLIVAPTGIGEFLADAVLHDVAKAAITVTEPSDAGHDTETLLAVRSPHSLWLFSVAPEGGAVADLRQDSLAALLTAMLSAAKPSDPLPPEEPAVIAPTPSP